jgi:hypothetical protein
MLKTTQRLSQQCQDSIEIMAIVDEIARADGWDSIDECFVEQAVLVETYICFAHAALRAIRRLACQQTQH